MSTILKPLMLLAYNCNLNWSFTIFVTLKSLSHEAVSVSSIETILRSSFNSFQLNLTIILNIFKLGFRSMNYKIQYSATIT
jgi:hypothetical protein